MTKPEATTLEVAEAPARMPGTAPAANGNGGAEQVLPGEAAVARAARRSLEGRSRGLPRLWPFLGPAFIAAVAYIDPGNFATNIAGGAKFGYPALLSPSTCSSACPCSPPGWRPEPSPSPSSPSSSGASAASRR